MLRTSYAGVRLPSGSACASLTRRPGLRADPMVLISDRVRHFNILRMKA